MISTIVDMKPALLELLRRIRERHDGFSISPDSELAEDIDSMAWSALKDFCSFLKAFKDETLLMSASEYPTLGLLIPVYFIIDKNVQKAVDSTNGFSTTHMMSFALAVKKKLGEYNEVIKQKPITLAASLDPRIKSFLGNIGINTYQIKRYLVEEWNLVYERSYNAAAAAYTDPSTSKGVTEQISSFLSLLKPPSTDSQVGSEPFANEVGRWMAHSPMSINQSSRDVCQWMNLSQGMYPRITLVAREFLGVTSNSVPSESAFSKAGTTADKRRARLGDEAVQAICELQSVLVFNKPRRT
jgi:hAT family C-terminal dimerisation region